MILRFSLFALNAALLAANLVNPPDVADWVLVFLGWANGVGVTTTLLSMWAYNEVRARR